MRRRRRVVKRAQGPEQMEEGLTLAQRKPIPWKRAILEQGMIQVNRKAQASHPCCRAYDGLTCIVLLSMP